MTAHTDELAQCRYGAVLNLYALYSRAVDEGRWDLLDNVFDENSTLTTAIGVRVHSVSNIKTVLHAMTQYRTGPVLHQPFNVHLEFGSDSACDARSNWLYIGRKSAQDPWAILSAGTYTDYISRGSDGWRFESRVIQNFDFPTAISMGTPPAPADRHPN